MLGVLLESKAARQRRNGGAATSVATHLAIIGLTAVVTAKTPVRHAEKTPETPVLIYPTVEPSSRESAPRPPSSPRENSPWVAPRTILPVVHTIPTELPPIDFGATSDPTAVSIAPSDGSEGIRRLGVLDPGGSGRDDSARDWTGAETMMRLLVTARPRYPERLRSAGINGRVRIRFVVDSAGKVELSSVQVVESTHDLFAAAVREILPALRFKPAEANGQRAKSLAEMPFEFQIVR